MVMAEIIEVEGFWNEGFNPLRIGSDGNVNSDAYTNNLSFGFNPLRIGSDGNYSVKNVNAIFVKFQSP